MANRNVQYVPGMTLGPGESTSLDINIPAVGAADGQWRLVEVPPPSKAPVQDEAKALGLLDGLRAETSHRGGWRCAHCHKMQRDDSTIVWVPDSVRATDSRADIIDQARRNAYNGSGSGWCLPCARSLGSPLAIVAELGPSLPLLIAIFGVIGLLFVFVH